MLLKILVSITAAVAVTASAIDKPVGASGCRWEGTAPYCAGECDAGWTERGRSQCGDGSCCWTGSKALCCEDEDVVKELVKQQDKIGVTGCKWQGTAPYCEGECEAGWSERGRSQCGDGSCCWTGSKALCCEDEDAVAQDL
ncbi:uncharacterized protein FSUBG_6271 [Fusarium subglutinans]|uniref:Uncharacterized protein n=1 Tax=Gibberella subglutinans TaxID=42677 RepID=A0A8H5PYF2_GIBSU|nr:uncharacterized protein FSUBG_6271 [Fusarium subglutinans]KAF5605935.1 hypothetical protein FSUBG_6271 [Fusarium subglutinans]